VDNANLRIPKLKWIGIYPSELQCITRHFFSNSLVSDSLAFSSFYSTELSSTKNDKCDINDKIFESDFNEDSNINECSVTSSSEHERVCTGINIKMISTVDLIQFNNSTAPLSPRDLIKIKSIKTRFGRQIPKMIMFVII
jgi:hypothetical protein